MKPLFLILAVTIAFAFTNNEDSTFVEVDYVSFTLRNGSAKSIPLKIPGVMNPNLSPASNSGVTLKIGQEILFMYRGKKRVLLEVSNDLEGQIIRVDKVLEGRKAEIDSK